MGTESVIRKQFSKWIVALSSEDATAKAKSFWDSENVTSSTNSVICFQNSSSNGASDSKNLEWYVHSIIECSKDHDQAIAKSALKHSWESEDGM